MIPEPPGGDCPLDVFDPNDSPEAATPIKSTATHTATLCAWGDEADWWTFTLSDRSYVGVEVRFAERAQDVALELWDQGTSAMIDRAEGGAEIQAIHELLERGTYRIFVERIAGDPTYTLETYALSTATPAPPQGGDATRVLCPRFDLDGDYKDAAPQAGVYEDFGADDSPDRWEPKAMLVRVLDAGGAVRLGWGPLDATGCTPPISTPSPGDTEFVMQYALWSHFVRPPQPDTFVLVYDCEELQPCTLPRPYVGWTTAQGSAVQETGFIASADVGQEFREELLVYWASAFAESRISMGVEAHVYARVLGAADLGGGQVLACPDGYCPNGTSCEKKAAAASYDHCRPKTGGTTNVGGHPTLDIAASAVDGAEFSGAPEKKFTIVHELGHVQTIWVAGSNTTMVDTSYDWCSFVNGGSSTHTVDSPEWQSAAILEGFADFYAVAAFNQLEDGAWFITEDVENDTMRYQAQCQASLQKLMDAGRCAQPGDATMCSDAGGSNEIDWAGTLWDFTKVVGQPQLPAVLRLLSDAGMSGGWDPGSTTLNAYNNISQVASQRFPNNGADFDAAAQANGTNR
ncbi:hypothetical protein [Enhygromyxa salina]|uniref:Uncharacterized protein n=1 Tax=Enhygromyxa salina TaxID=215803 RepID=A0A2S9YWE5_9BACT|nr:hypothetical protein [Enhygromyxa salina]PRQ09369.1 hypothetical protein ENSA7_08960 [Enhygromyxa salina]